MKRFVAIPGWILLAFSIFASGGWGALALYYSGPQDPVLQAGLAGTFAIAALLALTALGFRRWRWRALAAYLLLFAALVVWWLGIAPSNDRDWQPDVSKLCLLYTSRCV